MPPSPAAELLPIDWTNAVIIPLVLLLTVGAALAVYLGFLVSRLFAFRQIKSAALLEFALMQSRLLQTKNALEGQHWAYYFFEQPPISFAHEGFIHAAQISATMRFQLRDWLHGEIENAVRIAGLSDRTLLTGDLWILAQNQIFQSGQPVVQEFVGHTRGLRPDMATVLFGSLAQKTPRSQKRLRQVLEYIEGHDQAR
jgi:hypothetical protein